MAVKFQISSVAVLERILDGNQDIEVEIRQSVAQDYMKKHLKSVVNDASVHALVKDLKDSLNDTLSRVFAAEFGEFKKGDSWTPASLKLKPEVHKSLRAALTEASQGVVSEMREEIRLNLKVILEDRFSAERLEAMIKLHYDDKIEKLVRDKVDARLEAIRNSLG